MSRDSRRTTPAPLTGVILAGGKKRIGELHPALLPFGRELMVNRQFRLMKPLCSELILVTDEPRLFLPVLNSNVRMITDFYTGAGPLGGIHAALSLSGNAKVWLAGCDMPFLSSAAAKLMLDRIVRHRLDAVIPAIDDCLHPLHGVFDRQHVDLLAELAASGRSSVQEYLDRIRFDNLTEGHFQRLGIDPKFVLRANTREAYEDALRLIR